MSNMKDKFVKLVIDELVEEAYDAYVSYISPFLDIQTIDGKQIERNEIYEKMDELCQLNKWSKLTRNPKCYTEQLMYYFEAYARCDKSYVSGNTTPAYKYWKRGVNSLDEFMKSGQSFDKIELMEDAVKIFLCIMREEFKNTNKKKYSCNEIQFSINEKDIEIINLLHKKKTQGKYSGIRPDTKRIFGKTLIYPRLEENIVAKQKQPEKDYMYMATAALYCRLMESEGFY